MKFLSLKIFRRRPFPTKIKYAKYLCNICLPIPILVAKVWQRNLGYAKYLQTKYFTSENIPIYGITELYYVHILPHIAVLSGLGLCQLPKFSDYKKIQIPHIRWKFSPEVNFHQFHHLFTGVKIFPIKNKNLSYVGDYVEGACMVTFSLLPLAKIQYFCNAGIAVSGERERERESERENFITIFFIFRKMMMSLVVPMVTSHQAPPRIPMTQCLWRICPWGQQRQWHHHDIISRHSRHQRTLRLVCTLTLERSQEKYQVSACGW